MGLVYYFFGTQCMLHDFKQELCTAKRSWPASCDFGVVGTTDDDCKQQVPSVALRLQQLTIPAARRPSCSVYNSCGPTPSRTRGRVNICKYFVFETGTSPTGGVWRGSECVI